LICVNNAGFILHCNNIVFITVLKQGEVGVAMVANNAGALAAG
jgi:hypothetical protein